MGTLTDTNCDVLGFFPHLELLSSKWLDCAHNMFSQPKIIFKDFAAYLFISFIVWPNTSSSFINEKTPFVNVRRVERQVSHFSAC